MKKSTDKLKKILWKAIEIISRQENILYNTRFHEANKFSFAYAYASIYTKRSFCACQSDNTMNLKLFKFRSEIKWKFLGVSVAKHWKNSTMAAGNISSLAILNTYALTYKKILRPVLKKLNKTKPE